MTAIVYNSPYALGLPFSRGRLIRPMKDLKRETLTKHRVDQQIRARQTWLDRNENRSYYTRFRYRREIIELRRLRKTAKTSKKHAKLTAEDVHEIRSLLYRESNEDLAKRFGVCSRTISHIRTGKRVLYR